MPDDKKPAKDDPQIPASGKSHVQLEREIPFIELVREARKLEELPTKVAEQPNFDKPDQTERVSVTSPRFAEMSYQEILSELKKIEKIRASLDYTIGGPGPTARVSPTEISTARKQAAQEALSQLANPQPRQEEKKAPAYIPVKQEAPAPSNPESQDVEVRIPPPGQEPTPKFQDSKPTPAEQQPASKAPEEKLKPASAIPWQLPEPKIRGQKPIEEIKEQSSVPAGSPLPPETQTESEKLKKFSFEQLAAEVAALPQKKKLQGEEESIEEASLADQIKRAMEQEKPGRSAEQPARPEEKISKQSIQMMMERPEPETKKDKANQEAPKKTDKPYQETTKKQDKLTQDTAKPILAPEPQKKPAPTQEPQKKPDKPTQEAPKPIVKEVQKPPPQAKAQEPTPLPRPTAMQVPPEEKQEDKAIADRIEETKRRISGVRPGKAPSREEDSDPGELEALGKYKREHGEPDEKEDPLARLREYRRKRKEELDGKHDNRK